MTSDRAEGVDGGAEPGWSGEHRLRYQELFDFAPDPYLSTDRRGVILEANHAASALLRCPKEFLVGKPLGLFVAEGFRPRFYEALARLGRDAASDEFETRLGRRGDLRDVDVRVVAVGDRSAGPVALRWMARDITAARLAETTRSDLSRRLASAQEDERRRFARELHDSVGQLLAALSLAVHAARDAGPVTPPTLARLDEVQRLTDELSRATHDLALRLRPTVLDDLGLVEALRYHLEDWSTRAGVEAHFQAAGMESDRFPAEVETALYRVVQESLTNVLKHAGARLVSVVVGRQEGRAVAVVEDDGDGFDLDGPVEPCRLGLLGMRERIALLGGSVQVESGPGLGTTVIARVPLVGLRGSPTHD